MHSQSDRLLVIVDPYSTGGCLLEAARAIPSVGGTLTLWSRGHGDDEQQNAVHQQPTLEETAEALHAAASGRAIVGVVCGGDDGIELADSIARVLGLPRIGAAAQATGKAAQHSALAAAGLRSARSFAGDSWSHAMAAACASMPPPFVVKLDCGTGSEGVKLCDDAADARDHAKTLLRMRRPSDRRFAVLVQEYLRGTEFVVDCVSRGGLHKVVMIWRYDKRRANGHDFVYFGETPEPSDSDAAQALVPYTLAALDALGVESGPTHTELVWSTEGGACLVECNLRCHGGDGVWRPLALAASGHDQVSAALVGATDAAAFERLPSLPPSPLHTSGAFVCLVSHVEGVVTSADGLESLRLLESFHSLACSVRRGARLERTVDLFSVAGMVILIHADANVVAADLQTIRRLEADGCLWEVEATRSQAGAAVRRRAVPFGAAAAVPAPPPAPRLAPPAPLTLTPRQARSLEASSGLPHVPPGALPPLRPSLRGTPGEHKVVLVSTEHVPSDALRAVLEAKGADLGVEVTSVTAIRKQPQRAHSCGEEGAVEDDESSCARVQALQRAAVDAVLGEGKRCFVLASATEMLLMPLRTHAPALAPPQRAAAKAAFGTAARDGGGQFPVGLRVVADGVATPAECAAAACAVRAAASHAIPMGARATVALSAELIDSGAVTSAQHGSLDELRERARRLAEQAFGVRLCHAGALLSSITSPQPAVAGVPYDHAHVDKCNIRGYDVSAVLYLTPQRSPGAPSLAGGDFVFHDADGADRRVSPAAGRLLLFSSGIENVHAVREVHSGERLALPMWFSLPDDAEAPSQPEQSWSPACHCALSAATALGLDEELIEALRHDAATSAAALTAGLEACDEGLSSAQRAWLEAALLSEQQRSLRPPRAPAPRRMLLLCTKAGLCNRLRTVLSHALVAAERGSLLDVIWQPSDECPGTFTAHFEPPPGVRVRECDGDAAATALALAGGDRDVAVVDANDYHEDVKGRSAREALCWGALRARLSVLAAVAANREALRAVSGGGAYLAVHVRRTDHYAVAMGRHVPDEEFERFIGGEVDRRTDQSGSGGEAACLPVFLSTDCAELRASWCARHPRRCVVGGHSIGRGLAHDSGSPQTLRQTSLHASVVDLLTCVEATVFKGSTFSSYSDAISRLRKVRGTAAAADEHRVCEPPSDTPMYGASILRLANEARSVEDPMVARLLRKAEKAEAMAIAKAEERVEAERAARVEADKADTGRDAAHGASVEAVAPWSAASLEDDGPSRLGVCRELHEQGHALRRQSVCAAGSALHGRARSTHAVTSVQTLS